MKEPTKGQEIRELAKEYLRNAKGKPRIMSADCHGGGGSTTGKAPGCSGINPSNTTGDKE